MPMQSTVRTTREVFESHLALRKDDKLEDDLARNYDPDVVLLTRTRTYRGHQGVRDCARELQRCFPDAKFEYVKQQVEGDVAFLAWRGKSPAGQVHDGADTFLIRDGRILVQTISYLVDR